MSDFSKSSFATAHRNHGPTSGVKKQMRFNKTLMATAGFAAAACTPAHAYEAGAAGWAQKPGITLGGGTAAAPPPGLYMIDQVYTYQPTWSGRAIAC